MKILLTLLVLFMTLSLSSQIVVAEKNVKVNLTENGIHLTVPYGDRKVFEKALKDELKSWKGKLSTKDFFFADDCKLKDIGDNTFDAYAKVEDITKGGVTMSVQIDLGGAYLSSKVHPAEYKVFEKKLYDFAVKTAKDVIEAEAKTQEKVMKDQMADLEDTKDEIASRKDAIEEAKKVIAGAEEVIKNATAEKEKKEAEIKETEAKIEAIRAKKSAVK